MSNSQHKTLLPKGLEDHLDGDAVFEARLLNGLMTLFDRFGYARVRPPLLEYEDALFSGSATNLKTSAFRMMDPYTGAMLALRPDITPQIVRIACNRLQGNRQPLRLCYHGQVVRLRCDDVLDSRQFTQVGLEIIGVAKPSRVAADAEAILLAILSLEEGGIEEVIVDVTLPQAVQSILQAAALNSEEVDALRLALNHKDSSVIANLPSSLRTDLEILLYNCGPAQDALNILEKQHFVHAGARLLAQIEHCKQVIARVSKNRPDITITLDPLEQRGFEYHQGLGFNLYAQEAKTPLAMGGSYIGPNQAWSTGMTVYLETFRPLLKVPEIQETKNYGLECSLNDLLAAQARGERASWDLTSHQQDSNHNVNSEPDVHA